MSCYSWVLFSKMRQFLAAGTHTPGQLGLWNVDSYSLVAVHTLLNIEFDSVSFCFAPDASKLTVASPQNGVEMFDLTSLHQGSGDITVDLAWHRVKVDFINSSLGRHQNLHSVAFSNSGNFLLVGHLQSLHYVDLVNERMLWVNNCGPFGPNLTIAADDVLIFCVRGYGHYTFFTMIESTTGNIVSEERTESEWAFFFVLSSNEQSLVTNGDKVCVWNVSSTCSMLPSILCFTSTPQMLSKRGELNIDKRLLIRDAAFVDDTRCIIATCMDQSVRVWNVTTFEELHSIHFDADFAAAIAFCPQLHQFALLLDEQIAVYDSDSYVRLAPFEETIEPGQRLVGGIGRMVYSPPAPCVILL